MFYSILLKKKKQTINIYVYIFFKNNILFCKVAASPNNSLCAVGIAYNAQIGGIRMLDGQGKKFIQKKISNSLKKKKSCNDPR